MKKLNKLELELEELEELLKIRWNNSESMVEHCLKNSKYIKIGDKFIEVGSKKPTIQKQFWFDDEKPIPEPSKEIFMRGNKRSNSPREYELENDRYEKLLIVPLYHEDKTDFRLCSLSYQKPKDYSSIEVTEEMLKIINTAEKELKTKYEKRLETYWKRYSKHIRCSGYWVNR